MYKLTKNIFGECRSVIRKTDNASIPFDHRNVDYQEYLQWLDMGNTPEPADELPVDNNNF
jgi:hypothetical protein